MSNGRRLRLTVGDASLEDVGEGRARLSPHHMESLDLAEGELLRVHGVHPILVPVMQGAPEDEGLDILRLASSERRKAGVEIGAVVEAERHEIPVATRVRVLVVGHSGPQQLTPDDIRPHLAAQPVMIGDTVSVAPKRSPFDAQVSVLGLTVAEVVGSSTECGAILARIVETQPVGVVTISDETQILVASGESDTSATVTTADS